jgi:hypothetical protein
MGGGGGGSNSAALTPDNSAGFAGAHPAPVVINGVTYVYQNTGADGTTVQASSNGISFALTAATFPAGVSRTIVGLTDGGFRMYYFPDGTSVEVRSAISSNGLNWTVEGGTRYSDFSIGAIRATALPTGGYRLYYVTSSGISSVRSNDGLTFVAEGPATIPLPDTTSTWGPSAAAYVGGQFHMVLTKIPSSGVTELWHARSTDGRNWNVDGSALAVNPGVALSQPAWSINGNITRIYFRAQPSPGVNVVQSGIINF